MSKDVKPPSDSGSVASSCYVATLSEAVREAAIRINVRQCGSIASDVWSDDRGYPDVAAEEADYRLVAEQYDWLHNSSSDLEYWDKADIWVREFIDDIHHLNSSS